MLVLIHMSRCLLDTDALKKDLEEEYQAALAENELKMKEMQRNYEDMLKEAQENDAVSAFGISPYLCGVVCPCLSVPAS